MKHTFTTIGRFVFFTLLSTFFFSQTSAQIIGRQNVDQYPITAWGTPTYGLTWLPTDYASNTSQKYPLIIFLHGSGEGGDGVGGLWNLLVYGLPNKIANGFNPEAVNPVDGQNYKFIVVSPQAPSAAHWSYAWGSIQWILQDVVSRYRVDVSRIYVTGISAGGAGTWSCVTNGLTPALKFAAIVPVSSAGTNSSQEADQLPLVGGTYKAKVWSIAGVSDAWYAFAQNATNTVNGANPAPEVPAVVTGVPGGHDPGAWNLPYDANWRNNSQNLNIYEWMLKFKRGGNNNPPPPPGNQAPTANAGADQDITLPTNSIQLNGSGTDPDGSITSYKWKKKSGPGGANFNNDKIKNPVVSNLSVGTYVFELKVMDNGNQGNGNNNNDDDDDDDDNNNNDGRKSAKDQVTITVNPAPVIVPFVNIPGKIQAEDYASMSGIQTENTNDAGGGENVGWQDDNDWMNYNVKALQAGTFTVKFRVATPNNNSRFQLKNSDGTVLATVNVPRTYSWQVWQTVTAQVTLPQGNQVLKVFTSNADGGWNLNWIEFTAVAVNHAPVSNGGADKTIQLPVNTVAVTGSGSDDDGTIASYEWTEITGPSDATITNPNSASTNFSNLVQGSYNFRLKVTDNNGASATDDIVVTVQGASAPPPSASVKIEAEDYISMSGIQTENTSDNGGGRNVGYQDNNDWMNYQVNISAAGTYTASFRIATMVSGAQFQVKNANGSVLATVNVPNTGSYQTWQTVTASLTLPAGQQTLKVFTLSSPGGWNFNWWQIQGGIAVPPPPPAATSSKIEAENYSVMSGIQTENTTDIGGGRNVGYQDNNDWMDYSINLESAGTYTMNFRIATMVAGAQFQVRNANGSVLATVNVPSTGTYQTWQTISSQVNLPAGQQTIRIVTTNSPGGWNFNWMEIIQAAESNRRSGSALQEETAPAISGSLQVYPNPVQDEIRLQLNNDYTGKYQVQVINMNGVVVKELTLNKNAKGIQQSTIPVGGLQKGSYILKTITGKNSETKQIIKL